MHLTTSSTKRKTLQPHKETTFVCEKGIFKVKAISNLLVPHSNNTILTQKSQTIQKKTGM